MCLNLLHGDPVILMQTHGFSDDCHVFSWWLMGDEALREAAWWTPDGNADWSASTVLLLSLITSCFWAFSELVKVPVTAVWSWKRRPWFVRLKDAGEDEMRDVKRHWVKVQLLCADGPDDWWRVKGPIGRLEGNNEQNTVWFMLKVPHSEDASAAAHLAAAFQTSGGSQSWKTLVRSQGRVMLEQIVLF